jgi:hypothetical protein
MFHVSESAVVNDYFISLMHQNFDETDLAVKYGVEKESLCTVTFRDQTELPAHFQLLTVGI